MSVVPALSRGYRLRHDPVRNTVVILAPERVIVLDEPGAAVLELVDGVRTTDEIVQVLAVRFDAPAETIATDVSALLRDLRDEGAIRLQGDAERKRR